MRAISKSAFCGGAVISLAAAAGNAQFTFTPADYATPPEPKGLAVEDFRRTSRDFRCSGPETRFAATPPTAFGT